MCFSFNGNPCTTSIFYYIPTNTRDKTDIINFYNKLSSLVRSISKHNVLLIEGDVNALKGKYETNKFCLHK